MPHPIQKKAPLEPVVKPARMFTQESCAPFVSTGPELNRRALQKGVTCWFVAFLSLLQQMAIVGSIIDHLKGFLEEVRLDYNLNNVTFYREIYIRDEKYYRPEKTYDLYGHSWQRITMAYIFYHWEDSISLTDYATNTTLQPALDKIKTILGLNGLLHRGKTIFVINYDNMLKDLKMCRAKAKPPYFLIRLKNYVCQGFPMSHDVVGFFDGEKRSNQDGLYMQFITYDQDKHHTNYFRIYKKDLSQDHYWVKTPSKVYQIIEISDMTHYFYGINAHQLAPLSQPVRREERAKRTARR